MRVLLDCGKGGKTRAALCPDTGEILRRNFGEIAESSVAFPTIARR
jgi:hypothetical protein